MGVNDTLHVLYLLLKNEEFESVGSKLLDFHKQDRSLLVCKEKQIFLAVLKKKIQQRAAVINYREVFNSS